MSDNLLREVDEEVRRENLKKLWDKYGIYLIVLAVLIVAGTAGYRGYEAWQAKREAAAGDQFLDAVAAADEDRYADAETILTELEKSGVGDYAVLARMRSAALKAQQGDTKGAIADFDAVAATSGIDKMLRELATLRATHLMIPTASYDEIKSRAEPLASAGGSWRTFAREILGLSAMRAGDKEAARTWFEALKADAQAPQNARGRADLVLNILGGTDTAADTGAKTETQ